MRSIAPATLVIKNQGGALDTRREGRAPLPPLPGPLSMWHQIRKRLGGAGIMGGEHGQAWRKPNPGKTGIRRGKGEDGVSWL